MNVLELINNPYIQESNPLYDPKKKKNGQPATIPVVNVGQHKSQIENMMTYDAATRFSISSKEAEKYNKYGVTYYPNNNLDKELADAQSNWEKAFNSLGQTLVSEIGLGTMRAFTDLFDFVSSNIFHITEDDYQNPASAKIKEWQDAFNENVMPIYADPEINIQNGGLKDAGWWFKSMPQIASTLTLLLPTKAITGAIGLIGKTRLGRLGKVGTRNARRWVTNVNKAKSAEEFKAWQVALNNPKNLAKVNYGAKTVAEGLLMRTMENYQEASESYNTVYEQAKTTLDEMDEDKIQYWLDSNPELKDNIKKENVDTKDKDQLAKFIAKKGADRTFAMDFSNAIFDIIQLHNLNNIGAGIRKVSGRAIRNAQRESIRAAEEIATGVAKEVPKQKFITKAGQAIGDFFKNTGKTILVESTEGIEEAVNYIAQQEGITYGKLLLENNSKYFDHNIITAPYASWNELQGNLGDYMKSPELQESAFWGLMGGVVFQGIGSLTNKASLAMKRKAAEKKAKKDAEQRGEETNVDWYNNLNRLFETDETKVGRAAIERRQAALTNLKDKLELINNGNDPYQFDAEGKPVTMPTDAKSRATQQEIARTRAINEFRAEVAMTAINSGTFDLLLDYFQSDEVKKAMVKLGVNTQEEIDSDTEATVKHLKHIKEIYDRESAFVFNQLSVLNATAKKDEDDIPIDYAQQIAFENTQAKLKEEDINKQIGAVQELIANEEINLTDNGNSIPVSQRFPNAKKTIGIAIIADRYMKNDAKLRYLRKLKTDDPISKMSIDRQINNLEHEQDILKEKIFNESENETDAIVNLYYTFRNAQAMNYNPSKAGEKNNGFEIDSAFDFKKEDVIIMTKAYKYLIDKKRNPNNIDRDVVRQMAKKYEDDLNALVDPNDSNSLINTSATLFDRYATLSLLETSKLAIQSQIVRDTKGIAEAVDYKHNIMNAARVKLIDKATNTLIKAYKELKDIPFGRIDLIDTITQMYQGNKEEARKIAEQFLPDLSGDVVSSSELMDALDIFNFSSRTNETLYELIQNLFRSAERKEAQEEKQSGVKPDNSNSQSSSTSQQGQQGQQNTQQSSPMPQASNNQQQQADDSTEINQDQRETTTLSLIINDAGKVISIKDRGKGADITVRKNDDGSFEVDGIDNFNIASQFYDMSDDITEDDWNNNRQNIDITNPILIRTKNGYDFKRNKKGKPIKGKATKKTILTDDGKKDDGKNNSKDDILKDNNVNSFNYVSPDREYVTGEEVADLKEKVFAEIISVVEVNGEKLYHLQKTNSDGTTSSWFATKYEIATSDDINQMINDGKLDVSSQIENQLKVKDILNKNKELKNKLGIDASRKKHAINNEEGENNKSLEEILAEYAKSPYLPNTAFNARHFHIYNIGDVVINLRNKSVVEIIDIKKVDNSNKVIYTVKQTFNGKEYIYDIANYDALNKTDAELNIDHISKITDDIYRDRNLNYYVEEANETSARLGITYDGMPSTGEQQNPPQAPQAPQAPQFSILADEEIDSQINTILSIMYPNPMDMFSDTVNFDEVFAKIREKIRSIDGYDAVNDPALDKAIAIHINNWKSSKEQYLQLQGIQKDGAELGLACRLEDVNPDRFSPFFLTSITNFMEEYSKMMILPTVDGKQVVRLGDILNICQKAYASMDKAVATHMYEVIKAYINSEEGKSKYIIADENKGRKVISDAFKTANELIDEYYATRGYRVDIYNLDKLLGDVDEKIIEEYYKALDSLRPKDKLSISVEDNALILSKDGKKIGRLPFPSLNTDGSFSMVNLGWIVTTKRDGRGNVISNTKDVIERLLFSDSKESKELLKLLEKIVINKGTITEADVEAYKNNLLIQELVKESKKNLENGTNVLKIDKKNKSHNFTESLQYLVNLWRFTNDVATEYNSEKRIKEAKTSLTIWFGKLYDSYNAIANADTTSEVEIVNINDGEIIRATDKTGMEAYDDYNFVSDALDPSLDVAISVVNPKYPKIINVAGNENIDNSDSSFKAGSTLLTIFSRNAYPDYINAYGIKMDASLNTTSPMFTTCLIRVFESLFNALEAVRTETFKGNLSKVEEILRNLIRIQNDHNRISLLKAINGKFFINPIRAKNGTNFSGIELLYEYPNKDKISFKIYDVGKNRKQLAYTISRKNATSPNAESIVSFNQNPTGTDLTKAIYKDLLGYIISPLCNVNIDINAIQQDNRENTNFNGYINKKDGKLVINIPISEGKSHIVTFDSYTDYLIKGNLLKVNLAKGENGRNFTRKGNNQYANQNLRVTLPTVKNPNAASKKNIEDTSNLDKKDILDSLADATVYSKIKSIIESRSDNMGIDIFKTALGEDMYDSFMEEVDALDILEDILPNRILYIPELNRDLSENDDTPVAVSPAKKNSSYKVYINGKKESKKFTKGTQAIVGTRWMNMVSSRNRLRRQAAIRTLIHERLHNIIRTLSEEERNNILNQIEEIYNTCITLVKKDIKSNDKALREIAEHINHVLEGNIRNAKSHKDRLLEEFLVESLTNSNFFAYLNSIETEDKDSGKKDNLFTKIAKLIAKIFGFEIKDNSLYMRELNILRDAFDIQHFDSKVFDENVKNTEEEGNEGNAETSKPNIPSQPSSPVEDMPSNDSSASTESQSPIIDDNKGTEDNQSNNAPIADENDDMPQFDNFYDSDSFVNNGDDYSSDNNFDEDENMDDDDLYAREQSIEETIVDDFTRVQSIETFKDSLPLDVQAQFDALRDNGLIEHKCK